MHWMVHKKVYCLILESSCQEILKSNQKKKISLTHQFWHSSYTRLAARRNESCPWLQHWSSGAPPSTGGMTLRISTIHCLLAPGDKFRYIHLSKRNPVYLYRWRNEIENLSGDFCNGQSRPAASSIAYCVKNQKKG